LYKAFNLSIIKRVAFAVHANLKLIKLKLPDASSQLGFPGWLRIQLVVCILFFPGVKLDGVNVVSPSQLSMAGSLIEKLLNDRSFKILSEPSSFHDKDPFTSLREVTPLS
jgi:hypothetical protein